jgi:hypothetical protein
MAHAGATLDADVERRLVALDCDAVPGQAVADTLSRVPAPQIIALQGSVPIVTMAPFLAFLEAMGYPPERLRQSGADPASRSSFVDAHRIAGEIAWHYERDALMPMLIGHSQGGMIVIRVLHALAGTDGIQPIAVWPPASDAPDQRTSIVDPFSGAQRPVVGLRVDYATALVTGSLPRVLLGQWGILPLLREVPDSVDEFTGFAIPWDAIAGTGAQPSPYRAMGTARVRNVVLPASYSHIALPRAEHLAAQPATRAWVDAYRPSAISQLPEGVDTANLLVAADIWHSVKRHWCEGGKRLAARKRRAGAPTAAPAATGAGIPGALAILAAS